MSNKTLCSMKKHSIKKMPKFAVITIFFIFCSICLYAQEEKTKVDKHKFDKLTLEQKKEFIERAKEARDTALESVKDHDEVTKEAEKVKSVLEKVKEIGDATMKTLEHSPTLEKSKTDEKAVTDKEIK